MEISPLYEDNLVIAVRKPCGVLSQGDYSGDVTLIDQVKEYIRVKYDKPGNVFLGVIHRLDRQVSGVIVFAKNTKAASRLSEQMRKKQFTKFYIAVVPDGVIKDNGWVKIKNYITREKNISYCSKNSSPDAQEAVLYYKKITGNGKHALLLISLETGRKHQIRATMSSLNVPVEGDRLYRSKSDFINDCIALHSCYVKFKHPTKDDAIEIFENNYDFGKYFDMKELEPVIMHEISSFGSSNK